MGKLDAALTSPAPTCQHIFLLQSTYGSLLPPLYISNRLSLLTVSHLERTLAHFGPSKSQKSEDKGAVTKLRKELEEGMSRERRQEMQQWVGRLDDSRDIAAAEIYLARYPGFVLDRQGKLDYGIEDWVEQIAMRNREEGNDDICGCVMM